MLQSTPEAEGSRAAQLIHWGVKPVMFVIALCHLAALRILPRSLQAVGPVGGHGMEVRSSLHGAEEGRVWRLCWKFRACDAGISAMPPCFKPRALLLSVCPSDSTEQLSVSSILGLHAGSTGKSAAQRCSGSTPSCTEPSPWRPAAPGSPPTPRAPRLSLQCRRVLWH